MGIYLDTQTAYTI